MTLINDILWRIIQTKPFDPMRPRITRSDSYRLQGQTQSFDSVFSTIVVGRKVSATYFSKLIYRNEPETEFLGKQTFANVASSVEKSNEDLVIFDTNYFYSRFLRDKGFFISPRIDFVVDLGDSCEDIKGRMSESRRKKIARLVEPNYTFEITKDPAKVQSFYYEMYLPYVLGRYGELATPISFSEYTDSLSEGCLILARKDQEYVSGSVLIPKGDELRSFVMAVRKFDEGLAEGSLAAYYYTIVHGIQQGCSGVDFGETHPFMRDGVFQYKRQFGARVRHVIRPSAQFFGLRFSKTSEPVNNFLRSNPFVFVDETGLSGLLYVESINDLSESYRVPGLSSLYIAASNLACSNQKGLKLRQLSSREILNHRTRALGLFGEACKAEGYSIYHLVL